MHLNYQEAKKANLTRICGQCLSIPPTVNARLGEILTTFRVRSTVSPGFSAKRVEESLLLSPENTANEIFPFPNAGLVPVIEELASRLQIKVCFSRPRLRSWPQPSDTTARPQLYPIPYQQQSWVGDRKSESAGACSCVLDANSSRRIHHCDWSQEK